MSSLEEDKLEEKEAKFCLSILGSIIILSLVHQRSCHESKVVRQYVRGLRRNKATQKSVCK